MMMLESEPNDTEAPRYSRRQVTRVSKMDLFFHNLNPSPNCEIGSVFRNSKSYMDCFSMPFTKMQSKSDFVKFHFSRFFNVSPDSGQSKKSPYITPYITL